MPSERFGNLSAAKKDKIIWAAIDEFIEQGYEEASINSMIKKAGISRGSFYTYFADKDDIFLYVMDSFADIAMEFMLGALAESKGDIIDMMVRLYDAHENFRAEKSGKLFRLVDTLGERIFITRKLPLKPFRRRENFFQTERGVTFCKKLQEHSSEPFRQYSEGKFISLMELLSTAAFKVVFTRVAFGADSAEARARLLEWLDFIRRGA